MDQEEKIEPVQKEVVPEESKPSLLQRFWIVFVILAVIMVLIIGFLWASNQGLIPFKRTVVPTPTPTPLVETDSMTTALEQQETSDEISAIEKDLQVTDFSNLDKELTDIESELSAP